MKKKLKNIPKECVSFFVHCVSPFLILGGLSLFLTSCDSSSHQGRGLSTLVDRIKSFLGMGEHHSEPTQILSETESVPPSPEQNPTLATQPPSTEPALTVTGPAAIPSSQSAVDEREKTPATKQSSLSLDERMKLYTTFEETVLAEEEEKIKATENDASARIDAIMKDPRVVSLMKKNPNMTFEELPEDIYGHILDISESQEAFITTIMEESDKKLSDKAKELDVYEHINNEDLGSARDDKRRPLSDLKAKVDGNGIILDGSEESILNPQEELDTSKAEIKGEDNLKENTSEVKNNEKGRSLVKPSTGNKSDIINVPEGKEKGVVLDKTPQAPEKNSFNDDETS